MLQTPEAYSHTHNKQNKTLDSLHTFAVLVFATSSEEHCLRPWLTCPATELTQVFNLLTKALGLNEVLSLRLTAYERCTRKEG